MGPKHEVIVTIDEKGGLEVAVKGFKGSGCKALTEAIERDLGQVKAVAKTPEYNARVVNTAQQQARR